MPTCFHTHFMLAEILSNTFTRRQLRVKSYWLLQTWQGGCDRFNYGVFGITDSSSCPMILSLNYWLQCPQWYPLVLPCFVRILQVRTKCLYPYKCLMLSINEPSYQGRTTLTSCHNKMISKIWDKIQSHIMITIPNRYIYIAQPRSGIRTSGYQCVFFLILSTMAVTALACIRTTKDVVHQMTAELSQAPKNNSMYIFLPS